MSNDTIYEGVLLVRGKGTGFIALADYEEDILIDNSNLGQGLDGDIVKFRLLDKKSNQDRQEGQVIEVVKRARSEFVGTITKSDEEYRFQPDHKRIHIRPKVNNAEDKDEKQKLVVEIDTWPSGSEEPTVKITDRLGPLGTHETEMQAIIRSGNFATDFPPSVQQAAQDLYENREDIFAEALEDTKRRDMRSVETFTIDPADAKDFDDALSFQATEDGNYSIGIHIADVSHYVQPDSPLDKEALKRGTSVYLVDRVIPMLPEVLSNDLCSLRPNEDRLAFSAVFTLDKTGEIQDQWFGQTIIHSDTRFTYEDAQAVLDKKDGPHKEALETLLYISRKLRKKRSQSGAIAFEQPEVVFDLGEDGTPLRAYTKDRTETMLMIEDFMLLANENVAKYIHNLGKKRGKDPAFIYRIHDTPNPDKIEELSLFVRALGYTFESKDGEVTAKQLNQLMEDVEDTPEENLIKTATIRSMAKAVYSTKNIGHFGLAFTYYTHFTSPIRRYPDLLAHRLLRRHLDGSTISGKELAKFEKISAQSSEQELQAVSAERDSIKFKQVEYMTKHVGKTFSAIIIGVTDWGVYVQEQESLAEGMIHISKLGEDFFEHEKSKYRIKGQRTGKTFQLGDTIQVKLANANLDERQLDFELVKNKV